MLPHLLPLTDDERDVVEANLGVAYKFLNHPRIVRYAKALGRDARQEAVLGLIDAVKHYDSTKPATFATFAFYRILSHMSRAYRYRAFNGRPDKQHVVFTPQEDGELFNLLPGRPVPTDRRDDIESLLSCLTPRQRKVADYRLREVPFMEIGRHMGTSKQRIQQIWDSCVHKIRHSFPQYAEAA